MSKEITVICAHCGKDFLVDKKQQITIPYHIWPDPIEPCPGAEKLVQFVFEEPEE